MVSPRPSVTLRDILLPRPVQASQSLLTTRGLELTYNGRGALLRACTEIASHGKRDILLPAFHCPSGITPALHAGLRPVFYRVRRDLSLDLDDLKAKVNANTAAVLVIHYFGMATDLRALEPLRQRGIAIIEDWSHSFLQGTPPTLSGGLGDYCVYSFWKLVPCVVGGALWRRHDRGLPKPLPAPASDWRERAVRLKGMLEEALNHSEHQRTQALVAKLEALRLALRRPAAEPTPAVPAASAPGESHYPFDLTLAHCGMPSLARRVVEAADFAQIAARRRANFLLYARLLNSTSPLHLLYATLPAGTCPWVFPVLLNQRDQVDHRWRAAGVALHTFGIYLHSALFKDTDHATVSDAQYLSQHLLCLAIHQDLDTVQIERSATTINHHFE